MSIGKSSISRLSATTEPKKPEAPEVPAAAVAVPADQVVKKVPAKRGGKQGTKTSVKTGAKSAVKTTVIPAAGKSADPTRAAARRAESTFANTEKYAFGEDLPYWLL